MSFTIITVTDANAARADSGAGCKGYLCTDPKKEEEKKMADEIIKQDLDVTVPTPTLTLTLEPNLDEVSQKAAEAEAAAAAAENTAAAMTLAAEAAADAEAAPSAQEEAAGIDDSILTEDEKRMVEEFASKIDLENITQIMQYGAGTQKKMASFSESALQNVRTQDLGEVGDLITSVVGELKDFDATEEKGLFGFFKKGLDFLRNIC